MFNETAATEICTNGCTGAVTGHKRHGGFIAYYVARHIICGNSARTDPCGGARGYSHPYRDIACRRLPIQRERCPRAKAIVVGRGMTDHEKRWSVPPVLEWIDN